MRLRNLRENVKKRINNFGAGASFSEKVSQDKPRTEDSLF